jgi:transposase
MQTYHSIMDDIAFRIAILDTTKKTAEIALAYHVSVSHVRTLRAKHGRPYVRFVHYDTVVSRKWQRNAELVHDVRTMRVKEVMAKYHYSMSSVIEMRRQLGIGKQQILRSKEFRHAVKTRSITEVATMFGLGLSVVSKHRVKLGVAKVFRNALRNNPKFIEDVRSDRRAVDVARQWGCSAAYVSMIRGGTK